MTDTVVSSATREVVIGSGRPFVIIGERINPTGRKKLAEEMKAGDFSTVIVDAMAQVEAGAQMLDVNAGIPLADEPAILAETVQLVQSLTDVPLSIDSSIVAALEAGLAVYQGKPLVNSVTGEDERLEQVLPLVAKYGAAVVAITNDETGISEDPNVRFAVAEKIVHRAADHGIAKEDIVVDPLVMPIGAMGTAGRQVFALVRRLHDELGVNSTCGASNVSFGLPNRNTLNGAFLTMAIASGMTSAITSPLHAEVRAAVMAADVMMGNDPDCQEWIARFREQPAGAGGGRRGGRAGRRGTGAERRGATRIVSAEADALVVFTPSGKRGRFAHGTNLLAAARSLGVDLDSVCGGRGICGRCQIVVSEGEFAKHGISSGAGHLTPFSVPEQTYAHGRASRPNDDSGATRASSAIWSWTCRRRASFTGRSCGRRRTLTRSRSTRSCACTTSRSASRTWPTRPATWSGCSRRWSAIGRSPVSTATTTCWPCCSERSGRGTGPRPSPCTTARRSSPCGPGSATARSAWRSTSDRRRWRASCATWRAANVLAVSRRDEPADPVRRGPDEPRLLRDDEPGDRRRS